MQVQMCIMKWPHNLALQTVIPSVWYSTVCYGMPRNSIIVI